MKSSVVPRFRRQLNICEAQYQSRSRLESRIRVHIVDRIRGIIGPGQEGGSLVEFALVLPMMMILITGMFSIGLALNNYMMLTNSVGGGARALALTRGQTTPALAATDPCAYAVQVAQNAAPGINQNGTTYTIVWTPVTGTGGTYTSSTTTSAVCPGVSFGAGDSVEVQASYPFTLIVYGWRPGALNIMAQTTELVQ
jgi:Flp pilus assembly protein TadG